MTDDSTLDPLHNYFFGVAKNELAKARQQANVNRRAKAQETLREAYTYYTKLPRGFTDADFEQQYKQLHSLLYRGY